MKADSPEYPTECIRKSVGLPETSQVHQNPDIADAATFFLTGYDDLVQRPAKTLFLADEHTPRPTLDDDFFRQCRHMARSMKRSMLLFRSLVIPCQWLFNNPLIMALSTVPQLDKACHSRALLSSRIWIPSFDRRFNNLGEFSRNVVQMAQDKDDPSAWWYDVYAKDDEGKRLMERWVFGQYSEHLQAHFEESVPIVRYDAEIFKKQFREHLLGAIDNFHAYEYPSEFTFSTSVLRHLRSAIVSTGDLRMKKFRDTVLPAVVTSCASADPRLRQELADFARHAYIIALNEAHGARDVVFSRDRQVLWKQQIVRSVDCRLAGYLSDGARKYSPNDVFDLSELVESEVKDRIGKVLSRLKYVGVDRNYDLLQIEQIHRLRRRNEGYFAVMDALAQGSSVATWNKGNDAYVRFVDALRVYLEDIDNELKEAGGERGKGLSITPLLVSGVAGGGAALAVAMADIAVGERVGATIVSIAAVVNATSSFVTECLKRGIQRKLGKGRLTRRQYN